MRKRMFVVFSLTMLGLISMFALNTESTAAKNSSIHAFSGKLDKGKTVEMIYSREAKKLGVVVKDSDGKYLEGYILKNVSDIEGKYDLSLAKKFGEGNSLGNIIKIKNVGNKSAEVYLETNAKALALTINSELTTELSENPGCYWVCDGAPVFDWWTCFKCCLMPLSGCS